MARPWRIQYDGAYYHVLSRGNEGRDIFYDHKDRKVFLETLGSESRTPEGSITGISGPVICFRGDSYMGVKSALDSHMAGGLPLTLEQVTFWFLHH